MVVVRPGVLCILLALAGCKRSDDLNDARQMPKLAPPPEAGAVSDIAVAVEIDGHAAAALDRAKLDATPPDFVDGERRAWRVETLLGLPASNDGATFTVTGDRDVAIVLRHTSADPDLLPILAVNRRGQMFGAMVEKSDPFPSYHGQGRRLERRGDPLPRVEGVKRVVVMHGPAPASSR
jgi:hypothetical protein